MPWWGYLILAVAVLWVITAVTIAAVWSRAVRSLTQDRPTITPGPQWRVDRTYRPRKP